MTRKYINNQFQYFNQCFISILVILCILIVHLNHHIVEREKDIYINNALSDVKRNLTNTIFFGIVTVPNSNRQQLMYDYWYERANKEAGHEVAFICKQGKKSYAKGGKYLPPYEDYYNFHINKNYKVADKDRAIKRVFAARYFLENTTHSWYWSMTDDVSVDVDGLEMIIEELNQKYDTEKDYVLKGQCMYYEKEFYLQGGTGYIMSRAAARQLIEYGPRWIANMNYYDDLKIKDFRIFLGLNIVEDLTLFCHFSIVVSILVILALILLINVVKYDKYVL